MNCRVAIVKCRKDTDPVKDFVVSVIQCEDHWKVYLSILKLFENFQEPEVIVGILVYSKHLQFGLTPDDSRKVEPFIAPQSLQSKVIVTVISSS